MAQDIFFAILPHLPTVMIPAAAEYKYLLLPNIFKKKGKPESFRFITPDKSHFTAMAKKGDHLP